MRMILLALCLIASNVALAGEDFPGQPFSQGSGGGGLGVPALDALYLRLDGANSPMTGSFAFRDPAGNSAGLTLTWQNSGTGAAATTNGPFFIHDGGTGKYGFIRYTNTGWGGASPEAANQLQFITSTGASGGMLFNSSGTATSADMVFLVGSGSTIERLRLTNVAQKAAIFNDTGADIDLAVEGDTDSTLFYVDASTDRVGVGTSSPGASAKLDINGGLRLGTTTTALVTSNVTATGGTDTFISFNATPSGNTDNLFELQSAGSAIFDFRAASGSANGSLFLAQGSSTWGTAGTSTLSIASGGTTTGNGNLRLYSGANASGEVGVWAGTSANLSGATLDTTVFAAGHNTGSTTVFAVNGLGHLSSAGRPWTAGGSVGGSCPGVAASAASNDTRGLATTTSCGAGDTISVNFERSYDQTPRCFLQPQTAGAAAAAGYISGISTAGFTMTTTVTSGGAAANWAWFCIE